MFSPPIYVARINKADSYNVTLLLTFVVHSFCDDYFILHVSYVFAVFLHFKCLFSSHQRCFCLHCSCYICILIEPATIFRELSQNKQIKNYINEQYGGNVKFSIHIFWTKNRLSLLAFTHGQLN